MRSTRFVHGLMVALGMAAIPALGQEIEKKNPPPFDRFELTSSGGFAGTGSGKGLVVEKDGKFTIRTRTDQGRGSLKAEELARLRTLVGAVQWNEVARIYRGTGADFFQDDLVVTIGGKKRETHISEDADRKRLPPALRELQDFANRLHAKYRPKPAER